MNSPKGPGSPKSVSCEGNGGGSAERVRDTHLTVMLRRPFGKSVNLCRTQPSHLSNGMCIMVIIIANIYGVCREVCSALHPHELFTYIHVYVITAPTGPMEKQIQGRSAFAPGYTAGECQTWDFNSGCDSEPCNHYKVAKHSPRLGCLLSRGSAHRGHLGFTAGHRVPTRTDSTSTQVCLCRGHLLLLPGSLKDDLISTN